MKLEKFGNNDNLERFIVNNNDYPEKDAIVDKYIDTYLKAWADPKNTYEDNVFLQEEALRAAKNDPQLIEAYNKAKAEFKKVKANNDMAVSRDHSNIVINEKGELVDRDNVLSGEKEQI